MLDGGRRGPPAPDQRTVRSLLFQPLGAVEKFVKLTGASEQYGFVRYALDGPKIYAGSAKGVQIQLEFLRTLGAPAYELLPRCQLIHSARPVVSTRAADLGP